MVNVIVQNSLENDEIPKNITLRINYFQVSTTLKRIIDAQIIFSNPWNKSQLQNLNDSVPYTFNVFFNPYSHTNLMITFALSSRFYIVLYLVEGFASTMIVFIFFFLHRQFCHVKPRPTFKIGTYFPLILPPAIIGVILSIIPLFLEIVICHFFFVGKFLFTKVKLLKMKNYKGEEYDSIFDLIGYIGKAELSSIRKWLNETFYNTTFNGLQQALIDKTIVSNAASTTSNSTNPYACNTTEDKMFLLSYGEAWNYFNSNAARHAKATDYAKCQGVSVSTSSGYLGNVFWLLRSPFSSSAIQSSVVTQYGYETNVNVAYNCYGVRPACWITL